MSWSIEKTVWGLFNKFATLERITRPAARDGAEELAEREAEEEVSEPSHLHIPPYWDPWLGRFIPNSAAAVPRPAAACGEAVVSATPPAPAASPHPPDLGESS